MTVVQDDMEITQKYVLISDLCSSTSIIEDLSRSESQKLWRNLLIELKEFMVAEQNNYKFDIYKFIGDGWVLLFDKDYSSVEIFSFLKALCDKYDFLFKNIIKGVLSTPIYNIGITYGLDKGSMIKIVMNSQVEYVGRPINVASRLQGAIKDREKNPQGKVLMSNKVYEEIKDAIKEKYRVVSVERKLRNISGGDNYQAKMLWLYDICDHFYTTSTLERDKALNDFSYQYEGISCYVLQNQSLGTTPLFRLWNPSNRDHFYTTSADERDKAVANYGYTLEGISCYVYPTQQPQTTPLVRLWNPNNCDHFYTTSPEERDNAVINFGYIVETSYYVHETQYGDAIPLYSLLKTA